MDFSAIFSTVWGWILAAVGGVSLSAIIATIIYLCLKGAFNRTIERANLKKTQEDAAEQAADKAVAKIKNLSYKQSLQPIIEGQLKLITENAQEMVKKELNELKEQNNKMLNVIACLARYFDNSIGVAEDVKQDLKNAIADARTEKITEDTEQEIVVVEEPKVEIKETKATKKTATVER